MDTSVLEDLGLSNAEARIYLALLELGQSKTGKVIDKTKLQSSTVYHILGSLVEKGIVSYILQGKVKYFQAESPETLIHFLDDKKKALKNILPELKEKQKIAAAKQSAKMYEGINGVKAAFNDILESMNRGEEYFFFQFPYDKLKIEGVQRFLRSYHLKRSEKGIKVKGISAPECRKNNNHIYKLPNTKLRYIANPSPTVVVIYKNKILQLDWGDVPTAFTIHSETIYKSHKKYFLELWKKARP